MMKFSVIVRGENFLLNWNGSVQNLCFVTTRNVKADTIEEAKILAIKNVEDDKELQFLMEEEQNSASPPTLYVEEMYHLEWWKKLGGKGFTFYSEDS